MYFFIRENKKITGLIFDIVQIVLLNMNKLVEESPTIIPTTNKVG